MSMLVSALVIVGGYLLGSIATAVVTCRLMGLPDPRSLGSKNPGATNVLRHGGKKAAAVTLAGDTLKGLIPVLVARLLELPDMTVAATAVAACLGHLYPVFFRFRGGKGVATAFGAMLGISGLLALAVLAIWIVMALLFRYSSLSAIAGAVLAPLCTYALLPIPAYVAAVTGMSLLIIWRHRSNIRNLLAGTEDRIGERP
jgi:glycerol-3-phosphate acyltransferase PlsY